MDLKNRVPAEIRERYRDTLLDAEHPREDARALAAELEINFGVMWEWVLREAKARAERAIPSPFVFRDLLEKDVLRRVVAAAESDRTLETLNRLLGQLHGCEASPEEIWRFVSSLPTDGSLDGYFWTLIGHRNVPLDLLLQLLQEERFLSELCHRAGPRELLEAVVREMPDCSEAVLTLASSYATDPGISMTEFVEFMRAHRACVPLRKWIAEDGSPHPDPRDAAKLSAARSLLQEESA